MSIKDVIINRINYMKTKHKFNKLISELTAGTKKDSWGRNEPRRTTHEYRKNGKLVVVVKEDDYGCTALIASDNPSDVNKNGAPFSRVVKLNSNGDLSDISYELKSNKITATEENTIDLNQLIVAKIKMEQNTNSK